MGNLFRFNHIRGGDEESDEVGVGVELLEEASGGVPRRVGAPSPEGFGGEHFRGGGIDSEADR